VANVAAHHLQLLKTAGYMKQHAHWHHRMRLVKRPLREHKREIDAKRKVAAYRPIIGLAAVVRRATVRDVFGASRRIVNDHISESEFFVSWRK
jgi:hypothetical protein